MPLNTLKCWTPERPTDQDDATSYSLVAIDEVTPGLVEAWMKLPPELREDPSLAPIRRIYGNKSENQDQSSSPNLQTSNYSPFQDGDVSTETVPMMNHHSCESYEIGGQSSSEMNGTNNMKNGVKKKETMLHRGSRYCKIMFLLACWAFYTSILIIYSEKELIERHSSLTPGEVKSYPINAEESSLKLCLSLDGPFWSEPLQNMYRRNGSRAHDRTLRVWMERLDPGDRGSNYSFSDKLQDKSQEWEVYLLQDDLIDLSEGEPRSSLLEIKTKTQYSQNTNKTTNIPNSYVLKMSHNINKTVPFTLTYTKNPLEKSTGVIYAAILLIGLYIIIIFDLINRTLAAIITSTTSIAVLALVGERPSMNDLLSWMDSETLLLLFSMMVLVTLLAETGVFDYLAVSAFERTRGETWPLINMLYLLTIVVSLLLDNVTTVLLLTPATIRLCEVTNLNPIPILMGMVIFCNVGGTATPVGDPPNIIIATNPVVLQAGINFTNFTLHMTVGVVLVFIQTYIQFRIMYRDVNKLRMGERVGVTQLKHKLSEWEQTSSLFTDSLKEEVLLKRTIEKKIRLLGEKIEQERRKKNMELPRDSYEVTLSQLKAKYYIRDKTLLIQSCAAMAFIVIVFFLHLLPELKSLSLGWTALLGTTILLVLADKDDLQPIFSKLEWSTLLFFAALFIFMEAVTKLGLIQCIGSVTENVILQVREEAQLPVAILLVLWVSGITSAFVDNIPLTSMMVRVVTSLGTNPNLNLPLQPLIWALSFGACMGGNGTLVGASANVITAGVAQQHNYKITFKEFFKIGAPMTIGHLVVTSVYLMISHCLFTWH